MEQRFIIKRLLCLTALIALTAMQAHAANEALVPSSNYTGRNDTGPWGEVGYHFKTAGTARTVDMFGFIDIDNSFTGAMNDDGLLSDVTVTLWDRNLQTAVATATIPKGTSSLLIDHFRYEFINGGPYTLAPNTEYVISYNCGAVLDHYLGSDNTAEILNPYYVGTNPDTDWGLAYIDTPGSYPSNQGAWALSMTYGSVNLLDLDLAPNTAFSPDPGNTVTNAGDANNMAIDVMLQWKTGIEPGGFDQPNPDITAHLLYVAANDVNLSPGDPGLLIEANIPAYSLGKLVNSSDYIGNLDKSPWGEVGYRFKTGPTPRTVTKLGFIDVDNNPYDTTMNNDGLESAVTVTLWLESTAAAVAQSVIPSGTIAELVDNFRYAPVTGGDVTLVPDTNYVISFNSGDITDHYLDGNKSVTLNPYLVGNNTSDTWEVRWTSVVGSMPASTAAWGLGRTYGCCNMQFKFNNSAAYFAGGLDFKSTYYWRVDEIIPGDPCSPYEGSVWSFTTAPKVQVDIEPGQTGIDIDPNFFGVCLMNFSETDADMADGVIAGHLAEMPIKFLRFPCGTGSDNYIWNTNLRHDNTRWPYIEGPNTMDTNEFMILCQDVDAEPIICVNTELAFFETTQTAIDLAADWVQHCNITNNYNVKYWEIGNEPYWHTRFTAVEYANLLKGMAAAMKAVDPTIKIAAVGMSKTTGVGVKERIPPEDWALAQSLEYQIEQGQWELKDDLLALQTITNGTPWWPQVLENAGSDIDVVSIHWYFNVNELATMAQTINDLRALCQLKVPGKEIPIIMTEWNVYREAPFVGFDRALILAESAGRLMDGGLSKVNMWPLRIGNWYPHRALLDMSDGNSPTNNYDVLKLFSSHIGEQRIASASSSNNIYHFATISDKGHPSVFLINRSQKDHSVRLKVTGYDQAAVKVRLLQADGDPTVASVGTILDEETKIITGGEIIFTMPAFSMFQCSYSCLNCGICDFDDLADIASVWTSGNGQWDIAPDPAGDGKVNFLDFSLFSEHWNPAVP